MPACPTPPPPPPGPPAPPPAPVPVPPAPTPAPTPAPAPGEPVLPVPPAQIITDLTGGSLLNAVDSACSFSIPLSYAIASGASTGGGASMALIMRFQNLSPTAGVINFAVRSSDARLIVYDGNVSVSVPGNGFALAPTVTLFVDVADFGGYTVSIEDSNGNTISFAIDMGGPVPNLNLWLTGRTGVPWGSCPQETIGAGA